MEIVRITSSARILFDKQTTLWHHEPMARKILLVLAWYPSMLVLLLGNLMVLSTLRSLALLDAASRSERQSQPQLLASATTGQVLSSTVVADDARTLLLQSFLMQHESPLAPYADLIVGDADENGIDFRLVVAIGMCESNLGKRIPSKDSFNAWGIGVYTDRTSGAMFQSWPEAIAWVSRYIRQRYYDRGIMDLRNIGAIWAPPSVENEFSWTRCVESFQQSIL